MSTVAIILFLLTNAPSAQNINLSIDSIKTVLCRKWELEYTFVGEKKISQLPGANDYVYSFNKDNTFLMTDNNSKNNIKGHWCYNEQKKVINLFIKNKSSSDIISLKEDELIELMHVKKIAPNDPGEIKLAYKIKTD